MSRYDATFEVTSETDARAVGRLAERMYDTVREELKRCDRPGGSPTGTIEEFEGICEAARRHAPGTLTVVYERRDEPFDAATEDA